VSKNYEGDICKIENLLSVLWYKMGNKQNTLLVKKGKERNMK
jgi:hypothetical protein